MENQGYDIIGDIHGHAEKLIKLLLQLGYQQTATGYSHPCRKVIFLGDFVDRGEHLRQHRQLLDVVMAMVNNGHALAVMGNHEFNALAYHTCHEGAYLRPHTAKNQRLHQAFLNEFDDDEAKKQEVLSFFYRLPLFLDLGDLRVLHACWDEHYIEYIQSRTADNKLNLKLLVEASTEGSLMYKAIERLLKGVELELPEGVVFEDKSGGVRKSMRAQWWNRSATTLSEVALPIGLALGQAAECAIPEGVPFYGAHEPPCFIGHYWMSGEPELREDNVACLDYSGAKDGKLVAYRWSGEVKLKREHFSFVQESSLCI